MKQQIAPLAFQTLFLTFGTVCGGSVPPAVISPALGPSGEKYGAERRPSFSPPARPLGGCGGDVASRLIPGLSGTAAAPPVVRGLLPLTGFGGALPGRAAACVPVIRPPLGCRGLLPLCRDARGGGGDFDFRPYRTAIIRLSRPVRHG